MMGDCILFTSMLLESPILDTLRSWCALGVEQNVIGLSIDPLRSSANLINTFDNF